MAPVGSPWDRDGDGGATSGQPPQSRGGWKTSPKGPANPNTRWDHTGGGIVVPCGCHPPVPKRQGPPEVTFSLLQVLGIHQHHSVCKGRAAGWEGGGTRRDPWHAPATTLGPPAPLRAGGHPAPLTHGVHHVDVVHEVPLPQVDRELRGHERDSGVRAAPNPCPHLAFGGGGGETEARSARASPRAGQEEEIWAHRGGPRAHTPLLTPQWGLPQTLCSPLAQGPCSPRLGEALQ